jgi:hypothetical protein
MPDTFFLDSLGQINRQPANPNQSRVLAEYPVVKYSMTAAEIASIMMRSPTDPVRLAYEMHPRIEPLLMREASRPFLGSFGDSINSQDYPGGSTSPNAEHGGVSPMFWANALTACAFDYIGPFASTITPTGGSQTTETNWINGVCGFSGGQITQFMKYAIDGYLSTMLAQAGGKKFAVLLSGGVNDLANNDVAGHDATMWAEYHTIVQKILAAGGIPIMKCGEATLNVNTLNKKRNADGFRDRVMTFAAGRSDVVALDARATYEKYGAGVPWERLTRGTAGDEIHPNVTGAVMLGLGYRDALKGRVRFAPPWERQDFGGTLVGSIYAMTGTDGTKGTGANGSSEVPSGWTLTSFGANTSAISNQESGPGGGYGSYIDVTASGAPVADSSGLASTSAPSVTAGPTYRAFADVDVVQANYVTSINFDLREAGSTFRTMGGAGTLDRRAMTASQPNGPKLLEGSRIVMSSMPFVFPASPTGTLHFVGGGASVLSDSTGRLRSFTRFAGLVQQS